MRVFVTAYDCGYTRLCSVFDLMRLEITTEHRHFQRNDHSRSKLERMFNYHFSFSMRSSLCNASRSPGGRNESRSNPYAILNSNEQMDKDE